MIPAPDLLGIPFGASQIRSRRARSVPRGSYFVRGPIPLAWLNAAGRLPGRSLHVGVLLWFLSGLNRRATTVKLTKRWRSSMGIERHAAYRALERLERAGLVEVDRKPGRSPRVTLLPCGDEPLDGRLTDEVSDGER